MSELANKPIRVVLQQPALPKYRLAVFRELAKRPGIELKLIYGQTPGLPNVEPDGTFDAEYVPIKYLSVRGRQAMWHWPQVANATRKRADVLILSWNLHYLTLVPALLRAKASGVRTILWGHGYSRDEGAGQRKGLRERVGRMADALLFYGDRTAQSFVDAGWDPKRIYVARNALDQSAIDAARIAWLARSEELEGFRREKGLGKGPVCLFVSRLLPENRIDLLVAAVARLKEKYPALKVMLVGNGDQAALKAQAEQLGVAERLIFAGAVYDEYELAPYFLTADLFVYPAKLGLSILHSFGYGLPIVAAANLDAQMPEREALRDGVNGRAFRDDDPDDLARVIDELLSDAPRRRQMGAAALETVRSDHSIARMVDGFEAAIRGRPMITQGEKVPNADPA